MYSTILLIAGIALAYFSKPKDKKNYQMAVLSIIGLGYFCIWRFYEFYINVFFLSDNIKNISFLALMISLFTVCLLPAVRNISRLYASLFAAIFFICVVITFGFEKNIKNSVADWGGYFSDNVQILLASKSTGKKRTFKSLGLSINLPSTWQEKQHSTGLKYFDFIEDNKVQAQLRPRCFHNVDISIPEIIMNMTLLDNTEVSQAKKECFKSSLNKYICFVRTASVKQTDGATERWRWLIMDEDQSQNIQLDFVFYGDNKKARQDAKSIINSIQLNKLSSPLPFCISPIEWF